MQISSSKNEKKKQKSMTVNLLRKGMALSSKHAVDVLVVVYNRTSGDFQEFCSLDFQLFMDNILAARDISSNYSSYKLEDLPSLPEDDPEFSHVPNKRPRTDSPALSHSSSLAFLSPKDPPNKPLKASSKHKDSGVTEFLAMLKSHKSAAPTISTEDTTEQPSSKHAKVPQEEWQADEEWKDSPSDCLLDP
jgi:hypothetical protein